MIEKMIEMMMKTSDLMIIIITIMKIINNKGIQIYQEEFCKNVIQISDPDKKRFGAYLKYRYQFNFFHVQLNA